MPSNNFDADAYLTAALPAAALTIDPAWRAEVVEQLRVAAKMCSVIDSVELADDIFALAATFSPDNSHDR